MEIMQQTMAELSENLRAMTSTASPADKASKQNEMLKLAYERAVANTKELADLIQHSNGEALALLNKRFVEAMDEAKTLLAKTKA
jgi:phasin family protein